MIITKNIDYYDGDTLCQGFLATDSKHTTQKPMIMIAPDWRGLTKAASDKAIELAQLGYHAFALDVYGGGKIGMDNTERTLLMTPFIENRSKLASRMMAAFTTVTQLPTIDPNKIAIIGYCFGGLCALDLARHGADIKGVISFHGLLSAPADLPLTPLSSKLLILHGYDDPLVPPEQVHQLAQEMTLRRADWQIHAYGHTAHAFTNPEANGSDTGLHYHPLASQRAWQSALLFLDELF